MPKRTITELIIPMYTNEITTFDLDTSSGAIIRCKNCLYRYSFHCPLSISNQNYVSDNFYCAGGVAKND